MMIFMCPCKPSSSLFLSPLQRRRHTCAIYDLYGVTDAHSKEACTTLLILREFLKALVILFL
jgi:hypothetical protein